MKIKNKDLIPKTKATKSKNNQVELYQLKKLLHAKETINKLKRQPKECEKIFANYMSDKGLISKRYKDLR